MEICDKCLEIKVCGLVNGDYEMKLACTGVWRLRYVTLCSAYMNMRLPKIFRYIH